MSIYRLSVSVSVQILSRLCCISASSTIASRRISILTTSESRLIIIVMEMSVCVFPGGIPFLCIGDHDADSAGDADTGWSRRPAALVCE